MINILVCLFIGFFFLKNPVLAQETTNIERVGQLREVSGIWPNYRLSDTPTVLWLNNGDIYNYKLNSVDPAWQKIDKELSFSPNDHWSISQVEMHPEFLIENQKAYVFHLDLMPDDGSHLPLFVLAHEHFHPHQIKHFKREAFQHESYMGHLNANNLALLQLEHHLLREWLEAPSNNKLEPLKDFLAIHQLRISELDEQSLNWERHEQMMEGVADFVAGSSMVAAGIWTKEEARWHIYTALQSYIENPDVVGIALKQRHYSVGAALAFALEDLDVESWKEKVASGYALDDLLMKSVEFSSSENHIDAIKEKYRFDLLKKGFRRYVKQYKRTMRKLTKEFESNDGVTLSLGKPPGTHTSGGGENFGKFYLSDGSTISLKNSSSMQSDEQDWMLSLNSVSHLFQKSEEVNEFRIPSDLTILIDERECLVANIDQPILFTNLSWSEERSRFQSIKRAGIIQKKEGKLCIHYL